MTTKKVLEPITSPNTRENIKALMDEFEKQASAMQLDEEGIVALCFRCYDGGWEGSKDAKEDFVLGLLREVMEEQLKEKKSATKQATKPK